MTFETIKNGVSGSASQTTALETLAKAGAIETLVGDTKALAEAIDAQTALLATQNTLLTVLSYQPSLLMAISALAQNLTLEKKAAMDESTPEYILKDSDNYILGNNGITLGDLTSFTESDPGSKVTVTANKVDVVAEYANNSNVYKEITSTSDFSIDFELYLTTAGFDSNYCPVLLGDSTSNISWATWGSNNGIGCMVRQNGAVLYGIALVKYITGVLTTGTYIPIVEGVLYYCNINRRGSNLKLNVYTNSGRTTHFTSSPQSLTCQTTEYSKINICNNGTGYSFTHTYYLQNLSSIPSIPNPLTGTIKSSAITVDANIGLRYWGYIKANLVAGAAGSTIKIKIFGVTGTALHTNFITVDPSEYDNIPLMRPITLTATSNSQTVWNFTSLSNCDALINELGVLSKAIIVELALDGTNYIVQQETVNYTEDISNPLAPQITLVSGTGVMSGTTKLRVNYIVNIPLANTTIKLQIQLNRVASGDTSPSITPFAGDATKYVSGGQVTLI